MTSSLVLPRSAPALPAQHPPPTASPGKQQGSKTLRTCVIAMSHRNVKPHVSIKWQRQLATDSKGH